MEKKNNYLDIVFEKDGSLTYSVSESGEVVVDMENKGFANRIAQRFFGRPAVSHIHLEGMGSFIYECIDGRLTVYEIGQLLHQKFGSEAEPLYERLCVYMKQLEKAGFIRRKAYGTGQQDFVK